MVLLCWGKEGKGEDVRISRGRKEGKGREGRKGMELLSQAILLKSMRNAEQRDLQSENWQHMFESGGFSRVLMRALCLLRKTGAEDVPLNEAKRGGEGKVKRAEGE